MTQSQVCERGGELLPGAPSARPTPPAPPTEKRNPGKTAPRGAGLLVGPARPGPRPPLGGARDDPPTCASRRRGRKQQQRRQQQRQGGAAQRPGPSRRRPRWGSGAPHGRPGRVTSQRAAGRVRRPLSSGGLRRRGLPSAPRARSSGCARRSGRPGAQGGGARPAPHPRAAGARDGCHGEGRVPRLLVLSHSLFQF